ncbi:hypothetical protein M900_2427 [Bacteriovorax sp. Seq25_V]|nr:hypothetical protein M900_2427 [Bacteriovorax sp. Seq25_V]
MTFSVFFLTKFVFAGWRDRGGVITSSSESISKKSWLKLGKSERDSITQLLEIIKSTKSGRAVLAKAVEKSKLSGNTIHDFIQSGDVSVTDTTLIRKFSATDPFAVSYQSKSKIYLDKKHDVKNAVLDLVHELTHFAYKEPFNPYKENFSLSGFIEETIESKGGEVDAFLVECEVGRTIFGKSSMSSQCSSILDVEDKFSRSLATKEFYKLGNFYDRYMKFAKDLNLDVTKSKHISSDEGLLISSAWGSPYPMAIIEEYKTIMTKVCENDLKRLSYYSGTSGRMPASEEKSFNKMKNNIITRCANIDL